MREAATANIWWRSGGELYTPAAGPGVLPGVTRALALELDAGTRRGALPLAELAGADEAFTTSSIREVMPVVELDGAPIGDGAPRPRGGSAAGRAPATLHGVTEKIRLGGMALANGVLVHGPSAWACAIRTDDGELKVVARRKRLRAAQVENPLLRGPARIAEAFALLPQVKRALPEARAADASARGVLASMLGSAVVLQGLRRSSLRPVARELLTSAALASRPPPSRCAAASSPSYHGAEHISIGSYEHGERAAEGARALRLAPRRPDAADDRRRQPRSPSARRRSCAPPAQARGSGRRDRRVDGDLRLDDAPSRRIRSRARSRGPATSCSTGSARASRRAAQLEVAEAALRVPASELEA